MAGPAKRLHARFDCNIPIQVRVPRMKNRIFDAYMCDVGMGGALLSIRGNVEGPLLHIIVQIGSETADIQTRIARAIGPDKGRRKHYLYGVSFEADLSNEHHLRILIDKARSSGWSGRTGTRSGELRRDYYK